MTVHIYGIKACDTMKKAFNWLDQHGIDYKFQDFKKQTASEEQLTLWLKQVPWDELINKRGTSWRKLSEDDKSNIDNEKAISLIGTNNSMIKRPVLEVDGVIHLGFKPEIYEKIFCDK